MHEISCARTQGTGQQLRRHFSASAVTVVRSVGSPATVGSRVAAARSLSGCYPLRARFALPPLSRRSRKDATLSPCASFALCSLAFAQPFAPFAYAAARPRSLRLRCRPPSLPSLPTLQRACYAALIPTRRVTPCPCAPTAVPAADSPNLPNLPPCAPTAAPAADSPNRPERPKPP